MIVPLLVLVLVLEMTVSAMGYLKPGAVYQPHFFKSTSEALGFSLSDKVATEAYGAQLDRTQLKRLEKRSKIRIKQARVLPKRVTDQLPKILKGRTLPQLATYYERLHARRVARLHHFKNGEPAKPILYSWKESLAYLSFDLTHSYGLSQRIIEDSLARADWSLVSTRNDDDDDDDDENNDSGEPVMRSMLDFGSGAGSSVLAARDTDALRTTLDEATLIDPSRSMWEIAQTLIEPPPDLRRPIEDILSDYRNAKIIDPTDGNGSEGEGADNNGEAPKRRPNLSLLWSPSLPEMVQGLNSEDYPQYDLVTAMFSFSELPSDQARAVALAYLWKLVKPGGVLIIAEHSDIGSRNIVLDARELLIEQTTLSRAATRVLAMDPFRGSRPRIIAPCPHSMTCPMANGSTPSGRYDRGCFFTQNIMRTITKPSRKGQGVGRKTSFFNYAYFAAQKIPVQEDYYDDDDQEAEEEEVEASGENVVGGKAETESEDQSYQSEMSPYEEYLQSVRESETPTTSTKQFDSKRVDTEVEAETGTLEEELSDVQAARVLRHPLIRKGHVTLDLCQADGEVSRVTLSKSKGGLEADDDDDEEDGDDDDELDGENDRRKGTAQSWSKKR
ncbi:Methyltransferase-like protein 17, mitochondrial [Hondaea fermentalgiana]|uniref:Methyltransferase-like protein 17, mitochondrial n=1 Tax=Hondaea fermentalgiana TaxID=2315210 RepID=A0A2R5GA01_9STRA|nr:Methyltransferase-like protein 17, mitochondrial [Hondaea fermentalgiana]|eukprot:GBG27405.1 Methyltransferase-like protein 17, mitochondrial [Hondaea fermentalgiana]